MVISTSAQANPSRYTSEGALEEVAMPGMTSEREKRPIAWYVGTGLGMSSLKPDTSEVQGWGLKDSLDIGAQLTVGMDIGSRTAIEMHAADLGSVALSPTGRIGYSLFGASGLVYVAKKDKRAHRQGLNAFGRIGLGHLDNEAEEGAVFVKENSMHVMYGVGVEYNTRSRFGLRAEIVSYDTDAQFGQLALLYRFGKATRRSSQEGILAGSPSRVEPTLRATHAATTDAVEQEPVADLPAAALPIMVYEFGFDSDALSLDTQESLDAVVRVLRDNTDMSIEVSGHTDSIGAKQYNNTLSVRRADSVISYFSSHGIKSVRMKSVGYGETKPIQPNSSDTGRATNRRVEIDIVE